MLHSFATTHLVTWYLNMHGVIFTIVHEFDMTVCDVKLTRMFYHVMKSARAPGRAHSQKLVVMRDLQFCPNRLHFNCN